jgi:hypothetical protein
VFFIIFRAFSFSVLFPQLYGKCQGSTRKDGVRPALFLNFCVLLCIVCFVSFCVLFLCKCVLNYCHQVATQLQLIKYIISYHIVLLRTSRMRRDSSVGAVFKLRTGQVNNHSPTLCMRKILPLFQSLQTGPGAKPSSC